MFFKYSTNANYLLRDPTVKEKPSILFFQNATLTCLYVSRFNYPTEHITAKCFEVVPLKFFDFQVISPKLILGQNTPHLFPLTLKELVIFSLEATC